MSDWVVFKESDGGFRYRNPVASCDSSHLISDTKGSGERRRRA